MIDNPLIIKGDTLVRCGKNVPMHVIIPDGVKCIESEAFSDCESISSVVVPDSVTTIGDWAFSGCKNLTSVRLPQNDSLVIGDCVFLNCEERGNRYSQRSEDDTLRHIRRVQ